MLSAHAASIRGSWEAFIALLYVVMKLMGSLFFNHDCDHEGWSPYEGSQSDCPEF
jgi:hypothetical protein